MNPRPAELYALACLVAGEPANGELQALTGPFRRLAEQMTNLPPEARRVALDGFLAARDDADAVVKALAGIDPAGPPPEAETTDGPQFATLADIARIVSNQPWLWRGWLAAGVLNVVASEPGTGKTRFALDLARRLWFGLPWPDNQACELPERTRTLWVQGDQAFPEMLHAARDFGLPDEAVALGASPEDPTGGLELDDPAALDALAGRVRAAAPALVVLDTVGMVTGRDLTRPEEARAFFAPVIELARETGVAFLGLTHLNRDGKALGRRIVEKARVVVMMTCPDPEGQPNRRRLWVDKSAVVKPPPLGVTMGTDGNAYDFAPPATPEPIAPARPGPAPAKETAARLWLAEHLAAGPARVAEIIDAAEKAGHAKATVYRARTALGLEEYTADGRKWWRTAAAPEDGG